jgi:adenosine deaminase
LHIHIEGALGPELAAQNGIDLPYSSVDDMRRAYDFKDLQKYARFFRSGGGNIFLIILLWPNI